MPRPPSPPCWLRSSVLLFLGALASTGCIPGVAWLPDSSGFVYTSGEHFTRLALYDVTKKQDKVLVEDTGAGTLRPAVSPDGQRIAVARMIATRGQKRTQLQVVFYSLAGKELSRSTVFDWLELKNAYEGNPIEVATLPQLFWVPREDKLLIHCSVGDSEPYTAIYDVKTDRLLYARNAHLLVFADSPIRSDGAGFLVMKNGEWPSWWDKKPGEIDSDPRFAFVDFTGKERPSKAPPYMRDGDALKKEQDGNKLGALLWPAYFESRWNGDDAQIVWNVDRLNFLIAKGEAVLDKVQPVKTKDGGLVMRHYQFPKGPARLRLVLTKWDDKKPDKGDKPRLEILKTGQQEYQVLKEQTSLVLLFPSPNGKLLAVYGLPSEDEQSRPSVTVLDDQGEVVARFQVQTK